MHIAMTRLANTKHLAGKLVLAPIMVPALAGPALAHPGHVGAHGLSDGFVHPLAGLDHLLVMLGVGLLAWRLGGRAVLSLPSAFLAMMALGAAVAHSGIALSGTELIISASVLVVGLAIALDVRTPVLASMALACLFAFAHGQAHGAEIPAGVGFATYAAGFLAATAMLHAGGIGIGSALSRNTLVARGIGALIAFAGLGLVAG